MSKLAHSNQNSMEVIETRSLYAEYGEDEAFALMAAGGISDRAVRESLGAAVANDYALWIYMNLK